MKDKLGSFWSVLKGLGGFLIIYESLLLLMNGDWYTFSIGLLIGMVLVYLCFCDLAPIGEE